MPLMQPVTVRVTDPFWKSKQDLLLETTLIQQHQQLVETKRLQNFINAAQNQGEFVGRFYFDDSDTFKWIEACALALEAQPNHPKAPEVTRLMEETIDLVLAAQMENGYLCTFFQLGKQHLIFKNLTAWHEMYCMGHFIEAAVAHHALTGKRRLLDSAIKMADLLYHEFGPEGKPGYCGHQEIELALIKLAEATSDPRYRELARLMLERRGTAPKYFDQEMADPEVAKLNQWCADRVKEGGEYFQAHAPLTEQKTVVGHAVRAMYMWIAASQVADEMPDPEAVKDSIRACWANLTERRMYITGGIGPSGENEGFTHDYDLPNLTAYAETCASIGLALWGRAMAFSTGEADFMDVAERALYNGVLSGISESGDHYFYDNPLESRAKHTRVPWFPCACCPPNLARLIAQVGTFALSQNKSDLWLHLPIGLEAEMVIDGVLVKIVVESTYPASGVAKVKIDPAKPVRFALRVRIPEWCGEAGFEGVPEEAGFEEGYAVFDRVWAPGDSLSLDLEMEPRWIDAHPSVLDNLGRSALTYGPLVLCLESQDNADLPQRLIAEPVPEMEVRLENGLPILEGPGYAPVIEESPLYRERGDDAYQEATLVFRPYFTWNNRGASHMQVWVRRTE